MYSLSKDCNSHALGWVWAAIGFALNRVECIEREGRNPPNVPRTHDLAIPARNISLEVFIHGARGHSASLDQA